MITGNQTSGILICKQLNQINMIETIVSLETAKLLKEKGFNEPCLYYFGCDDKGNLIPKCVAGIQDCECRTVEDLYIQNNLLMVLVLKRLKMTHSLILMKKHLKKD